MEEITKQLLTTIAENQPKIKEVGYNEGFSAGYDDGLNLIEKAISNNGIRKDYRYCFNNSNYSGYTFRSGLIKPKSAGYMFYQYQGSYLPEGFDLSEIVPSTSDNEGVNHAFRWANIVYLPDLKIPANVNHKYFVNNAKLLEKIECLHSSEEIEFTQAFLNCYKLKQISFEGVIGRDISFAYSPLTVESMKNIITHLKDYSADTANHYAYTVTFLTSAFEALEAEGATAEYNGVACTWTELIDNLKWNLTLA